MPNSGNGDALKFGAYLISLDSSLAGAGRLNPRKREAGADEPAARRMLSIWPCRPPSTGPTRAGSRASRPLTLSFIYIYIHIYVAFALILTTLGDDEARDQRYIVCTRALKKSCRIMTPEIIS